MTEPAVGVAATHAQFADLLDRLAGQGEGARLLERLAGGAESAQQIARSIAVSPAFETLYKEARTLDIGVEGAKAADPAFVGIAELRPEMPFAELFRTRFRPLLGKRADGFGTIFDALGDLARQQPRELLILETGCLRVPRNWDGDGQSTFMFDAFARAHHALFFSIDITMESIATARRACSSATHLIVNDSVAALHALSRGLSRQASLLYLDSYDFDPADPMPSAIHHALELTAARALIGPGTIVCVDDYEAGPGGGKGLIANMFFSSIRAQVLHSGYQKVWRVA